MKNFLLSIVLCCCVAAVWGNESGDSTAAAARTGHKLYEAGRLSDAILAFSEVAEAVRAGDADTARCRDLYVAGNACLESNRFIEALEFYTAALELARRHSRHADVAGLSANIGVVYSIFKDYDRSIHYYGQAFAELQRHPDPAVTPIVLANLVNSCSKAGKPAEARKYLRLQAQHPLPDRAVHQYHIYYNQGIISASEGNHAGNLYYQQRALGIVDAHGLPDLMRADVLDQIGDAYAGMGELDSALSAYRSMLHLSEGGGYVYQESEAIRKLASLLRRAGRSDSAAYYMHRQAAIDDSLFNMQQFNSAKDRLARYEDFLASSRIDTLDQRNRVLEWTLAGVCLLLALGGGWIVSVMVLNRRLRQTRVVLVHKNEELMTALGEAARGQSTPLPTAVETGQTSDRFVMSEQTQDIIRSRVAAILNDIDVITDPEFSLARLAELSKTNTKYVSQVVNLTYGKPFKAVLAERRINEASRRLSDAEGYGHLTVTAIGMSVGFNSPTGFTDVFKRINGMTPGTYRSLSQAGRE